MTKEQMWEEYKRINQNAEHYDAWCFGSSAPDGLADLVFQGVKTSTASAFLLYEMEKCSLPPVGGYNIILKTNDDAVCIIQTTDVTICKFREVSAQHAFNEGEGDRSLDFWRKVHKQFFSMELAEHGVEFDEDMLVVCETFNVVYK